MDNKETITKYQKAKLRVERVKGFYTHFSIFILVNLMIIGLKLWGNFGSWTEFTDKLLTFDTLSSFVIWGAILTIHALTVFVFPSFMGYKWQERKIQEFMEEELKYKK